MAGETAKLATSTQTGGKYRGVAGETAELATSTQTGGKYRGVAGETAKLATSDWRKVQRGGKRDSRTRHVRLEESTEGR